MLVNNSITCTCAVVSVDPKGFLRMTMRKTEDEIDLAEAKLHIEAAHTLTAGKRMPVLIDARNYVSMTKEAREYFSKNEIVEGKRIAEALLVNNLASKLMAKAYTVFNKPDNPHKIFTSENEAVKWLLNFKS
jgi:hypothetical protein